MCVCGGGDLYVYYWCMLSVGPHNNPNSCITIISINAITVATIYYIYYIYYIHLYIINILTTNPTYTHIYTIYRVCYFLLFVGIMRTTTSIPLTTTTMANIKYGKLGSIS